MYLLLFEIGSSIVVGGVLIYTKIVEKGSINDADKIQRICANCGLKIREGKETRTIQLLRKDKHKWGTEYAYRIPLGLSFSDFHDKLDHLQDGLNHKSKFYDLSWSDLRALKIRRDIVKQIRRILNKKRIARKEIELDYDGVLRIKVYEKAFPKQVDYDSISLKFGTWKVPIGQIRGGDVIFHDFEAAPHFILGGATRYGKSNFLNMLIVTLLLIQGKNVSFTLIDLKGGIEFGDYENVKQVKHYAEEPEEAKEALKAAVKNMYDKRDELRSKGFRKVQDANDLCRHFIIIDEVGELNPDEAVNKEEKELKEACQTYMSKISRLGAGLGFRLIQATQYGTGDIIPRQCKQNADTKLCFRVQDGTASRVVLGREGAENLPEIKGRAIYQTADKRTIVQTPRISDKKIKHVITPFINIRPRKEKDDEEDGIKRTAERKHTLVVEEIGLSD